MHRLFTQHSDHPLFRYMNEGERSVIEAIGRVRSLGRGEVLIQAGARDTSLFGVEEGFLDIVARRGDDDVVIATVGPGEILGEISFIDDSPRVATVRARDSASVRVWERDLLLEALQEEAMLLSKFSVAMAELLVERLRETARRV